MKKEKNFKSIFSPNKEIDIYSHITEVVINNKIEFKNKKEGIDLKPRCDFWTNEKSEDSEFFKQLQKDYRLEITYIKNLTKVFNPQVVLSYVKERKIITFRYLKLDKQQILIYNLYMKQIQFLKDRQEIQKKAEKENTESLNFFGKKPKESKISKIL